MGKRRNDGGRYRISLLGAGIAVYGTRIGELMKGQQWAVVGPNGAGKKTLITDIITRKFLLKEGEVVFSGMVR